MKRTILLIILLTANAAAARAADVSNIMNFRMETKFDGNMSKASAPGDQREDIIITTSGSIGHRLQLSAADRLSLTIDLKREEYMQYRALSNVQVGISASWFRRFGIGEKAPWLNASVSGAHVKSGNRLQEGADYSASIAVGKNITDRFSLTMAQAVRGRNTPSNDAYNANSYTTSISGGYSFRNGIKISGSYGLSRGDITAQCFPFKPGKPVVRDEVFGAWAYRRQFKTQIYSLMAAYPIGYTSTLYIGSERLEARWGKKSYPLDTLRIGIARAL